jgi:GDSL/SGNH-like Acyl-Esterase family found in Pmr5 and Cas1p
VLNRGAHYKADAAYLEEWRRTLDVVEEWLARCKQLKIKCHFFWRSTVPGHHHCHDFTEPVNDLAVMEAHVANLSLYDSNGVRYHWQGFRHQNLLAEAELERRRANLPYRVLDGYRINILRPDGHARSDCLHSCYPGKMDVYAQLLLHYLRGDRSVADVERLRSVHDEQRWNLNVTTVYDARPGPT